MKVKLFRSEFYVKQIRCQEENNFIIEVEKANDEEHKTNIFFSPDGQYSVMIYEGYQGLCMKIMEQLQENQFLVQRINQRNKVLINDDEILEGIKWYEEYGFVKLILWNWLHERGGCKRLYFDRKLYIKEKKNKALNMKLSE